MAFSYSKSISNILSDQSSSKGAPNKANNNFSTGRLLKNKKLSVDLNLDKNYVDNSSTDFSADLTLVDPNQTRNGRVKIKRPKSALGPFFASSNTLSLSQSNTFNNSSNLASLTGNYTKHSKKLEKQAYFKEDTRESEFSSSFSQLFFSKANGAGLSASLQGSLFKAGSSGLNSPLNKNTRNSTHKGYLFGRQRYLLVTKIITPLFE